MSNLTGITPYNVSTNYIFDPRQISGCALWLDAADSASVIRTGSSVTQWNDKSGNNYNASAFGTPTYVNSVANNLPAIRFNGTSTYFSIPGNQLDITTEDFAIFSVVQYTTKSTQLPIIGKATGASATQQWRLAFDPLNLFQIVVFKNSAFVLSQATYTTPGWTLFGGVAYRATSIQGFINGTGLTAGGALTGTLTDTATNVEIGRGWSGTQYFNSDMGEILLYKGTITTTQRQQIEGYLAWKWGTQASLPTTHPYYNNAYLSNSYPISYFPPRISLSSVIPVVSGFTIPTTIRQNVFSPRSISGNALWLDAADPLNNGTRPSSGTTISTWSDKSGNGRNATTANAIQYIIDSQNRNAIYINNSQSFSIPSFAPSATSQISVFCVINQLQTVGPGNVDMIRTSSYANFTMNLAISTNNYNLFLNNASVTSATTFSVNNIVTICEIVFNVSSGNTFVNGATTTTFSAAAGTALTTSQTLVIGGNTTINMNYYELLFYNTALTVAQRQQIEGYLAWKWGLQSNLPANHPFKLFPP